MHSNCLRCKIRLGHLAIFVKVAHIWHNNADMSFLNLRQAKQWIKTVFHKIEIVNLIEKGKKVTGNAFNDL